MEQSDIEHMEIGRDTRTVEQIREDALLTEIDAVRREQAEAACHRAKERYDALVRQHVDACAALALELPRDDAPSSLRTATLLSRVVIMDAELYGLAHQLDGEIKREEAALGGEVDPVRQLERYERAERAFRAHLDAVVAARASLAADARPTS